MKLVLNEGVYGEVMQGRVPLVEKWLWIATADVKDLHVEGAGGKFVPFVGVLGGLVEDGVEVRLIHAKEPGPRFRRDFDKYPALAESDLFERVLCVRMHMKVIIGDGAWAYVGSANLTGAGLGAKGADRRNFEAGFVTEDAGVGGELMEFFDGFWMGGYCERCQRREVCPDPIV
ncbi:MAG: phospholipase D-like domain-containing protein [Verrucomicrobiota bacterium]